MENFMRLIYMIRESTIKKLDQCICDKFQKGEIIEPSRLSRKCNTNYYTARDYLKIRKDHYVCPEKRYRLRQVEPDWLYVDPPDDAVPIVVLRDPVLRFLSGLG